MGHGLTLCLVLPQILYHRLKDGDLIACAAKSSIAGCAKQGPHLACGMAMVDMWRPAERFDTDGAFAALQFFHSRDIVWGEAVTGAQPVGLSFRLVAMRVLAKVFSICRPVCVGVSEAPRLSIIPFALSARSAFNRILSGVASWAGRFRIVDCSARSGSFRRCSITVHATTLYATPCSVKTLAPLNFELVEQGGASGAGTWPEMLLHHHLPPVGGWWVERSM